MNKLDFLNRSTLCANDTPNIEEVIFGQKQDDLVNRTAQKLLGEVLRLRAELNKANAELYDERYQYAGGRIHRFAILTRNAEIDRLQEELNECRKKTTT